VGVAEIMDVQAADGSLYQDLLEVAGHVAALHQAVVLHSPQHTDTPARPLLETGGGVLCRFPGVGTGPLCQQLLSHMAHDPPVSSSPAALGLWCVCDQAREHAVIWCAPPGQKSGPPLPCYPDKRLLLVRLSERLGPTGATNAACAMVDLS